MDIVWKPANCSLLSKSFSTNPKPSYYWFEKNGTWDNQHAAHSGPGYSFEEQQSKFKSLYDFLSFVYKFTINKDLFDLPDWRAAASTHHQLYFWRNPAEDSLQECSGWGCEIKGRWVYLYPHSPRGTQTSRKMQSNTWDTTPYTLINFNLLPCRPFCIVYEDE